MRLRLKTAPLLALAGLLSAAGLADSAAAQAPDAGAGLARTGVAGDGAAGFALQHSFPLAGGTLLVVVDGLAPGEDVMLRLRNPAEAPPSVTRYLADPASAQSRGSSGPVGGLLTSVWFADELGRVVLAIPLLDAADAERTIVLDALTLRGVISEPLHLQVQPPMLLLPAHDGVLRISLQDGTVLLPALPADGGLRGAALSADGVRGYVLREGGLLEVRGTHQWNALPLSRRVLDPAADTLAGSAESGVAFALARPAGLPFTPGGELLFLGEGEGRPSLLLEPMGQGVAGRRAVVAADGLTAFVAEDDLVVREIDLLSGTARGLLAVGMAGDGAITDLLLDGRRLLVATRGPLGRRGSLTTFDLDAGLLFTHALAVDPLRFVALEGDRVLVVPAAGPAFQLVEGGLPSRLVSARGGRGLDAVAVEGGALLLRALESGVHALERFDAATGALAPAVSGSVPAATRLVGGGAGAIVLLGDPSGAVHVLPAGAGAAVGTGAAAALPSGLPAVMPLPGVTALPGGTFAVLP